ncbi:MAG: hypothetical protein DIJKHBIC_03408 [Thermoanaerobaculia bacterium]|nr:hypothetical protein [Thermoanaerobaculia bacterium]
MEREAVLEGVEEVLGESRSIRARREAEEIEKLRKDRGLRHRADHPFARREQGLGHAKPWGKVSAEAWASPRLKRLPRGLARV